MMGNAVQIELRSPASLRAYAGNARIHSKKQVRQIADLRRCPPRSRLCSAAWPRDRRPGVYYNVAIYGNVCGSGRIKYAEFAMASGEMSAQASTAFPTESLGAMAAHSRDGAIAFVCMDWRHMGELLAAGGAVFTEADC